MFNILRSTGAEKLLIEPPVPLPCICNVKAFDWIPTGALEKIVTLNRPVTVPTDPTGRGPLIDGNVLVPVLTASHG